MDAFREERVRLEASALLALGWVPSSDEPGRLYPLQADMPPVQVDPFIWALMLELFSAKSTTRPCQ